MSNNKSQDWIPFNKPYLTGKELSYIAEAHINAQLAGDGQFTKKCQRWLEETGGHKKALLTHSCTAALEMSALLCNIGPGDEVIMPSFTFVSTANAFVLRGATPVFVDIRPDTLNIDEKKIEAAITPRTRAIVPVHYAGVACEMDTIMDIANRYGLYVIEDAAQGCTAKYKGRRLGSIGHLGCYSFHETKNIICGEGGALLINCESMVERAEIIREKGTNRSRYLRGETDKYTWTDVGSSFLPGEILAAFLFAQIEQAEEITNHRMGIWKRYHDAIAPWESHLKRPTIPTECQHNAHMYYIINRSPTDRQTVIDSLKELGIHSVFHYVPLHSSPFGKSVGRCTEELKVTDYVAENLIRLPIWIGLTEMAQKRVTDALASTISHAIKQENECLALA